MATTALHTDPAPTPYRPSPLGMPVAAVAALTALAVPRALAHDLGLAAPTSLANGLLSVGPLIVWVAVATIASRRPLATLIAAGTGYGIVLGLVHNITWASVWAGNPPRLGGALAGAWPPATEELLMRGATGLSALATGTMIGVMCGIVAWALQEVARRKGARLPLR